jgi:2-haloacid dehalogenase
MSANRRSFLGRMAGAGLVLQAVAKNVTGAGTKIRAIAFDGFPILDPRPVFALVNELYPEKGGELANAWRTRQFEYTWLRTMSRNYADFRQVTADALVFAAKSLKVRLPPDNRERLINAYFNLRCWPDVPAAVGTLRKAGIRMAFLSNLTAGMLGRTKELPAGWCV